jgi:repressor LexA
MNLSSLATVHEHLQALERKGIIRKFEGAVRGIEIIDDCINANLNAVELPLMGYIAAGQPIEAIENTLATVMVSPDMVSKSKRCFVLQVKGDSMIGEGIMDGDFVVLKQQETAENGQIVVALIDNGFATLKTFYREKNGKVRLQPANDKMQPIIVEADNCKVQGVVTGIVRRYNH